MRIPLSSKEINDAAEKVIGTAFDEFNMLYQRDAFLTNRLTTFIERDFAIRIREGLNMTQYTKSLMIINQNHLLEKLVEVHGVNPTDSAEDLSQAQHINQRNIETLEDVFGDTLYRMIISVRSIAEGKGEEWAKDKLNARAMQETDGGINLMTFFTAPGAILDYEWTKYHNPDLYGSMGVTASRVKHDDKHQSYHRIVGKICAQSLAFESRAKFADICHDTKMNSWYGEKQLDFNYEDYVPHNPRELLKLAGDSDFYGKYVCAYNRFQIRNIVNYLNAQSQETFGTNNP